MIKRTKASHNIRGIPKQSQSAEGEKMQPCFQPLLPVPSASSAMAPAALPGSGLRLRTLLQVALHGLCPVPAGPDDEGQEREAGV